MDGGDDADYARELWKIRRSFRFVLKRKSSGYSLKLHLVAANSITQQEFYDLAWSPDSELLLLGSTDNTARVIRVADGSLDL